MNTYHEPLFMAYTEFCDRWLCCSFTKDGYQCCNARKSHEKGHQADTGRILARNGQYQSPFDSDMFFPVWIDSIDRDIKAQDSILRGIADRTPDTLARRHEQIMANFYKVMSPKGKVKSHLTCLCCVRKIPDNVLPCEHILCKECIRASGRSVEEHGVVELRYCPLHPAESRWPTPARIKFKPLEAGVRVLCLDG